MQDTSRAVPAVAGEDSVLVMESTLPNPPQSHLDVILAVIATTLATSFPRFLELPQEIHLQIWKDAAHLIEVVLE